MIIITGTVEGSPDTIEDLIAVSLEHVRRSRTEPGCLSHAVHRDIEDADRLFFFEQWADHDAVRAHFAVPESAAFVEAVGRLAVGRASINLYEAQDTTV